MPIIFEQQTVIAHGNRTETYVETVEAICASSCIGNNCKRNVEEQPKGVLETVRDSIKGEFFNTISHYLNTKKNQFHTNATIAQK